MRRDYDFRPGDIISVRFGGVLRHYGVVTLGGRVVSSSRRYGGVVAQSIEAFALGRPVRRHGRSSEADPYLAHARVHRRLGSDYSLTGSNCVHLARHARGRKPTVTQVARATAEAFLDMLGPKRR